MTPASALPDLYLMRHGETQWNAEGRLQGRLDSPLTLRGRAQAAQLARLLPDRDCLRISSPQGRAVETAQIAFAGRPFAIDPRLAEIDIGAWSGLRLAALRADAPEMFRDGSLAWYDHAPGGEHFAGLTARLRDFLDDLHDPAMIVTHGVTLRMLRILAMGAPAAQLGDLPVEQGSVHLVRCGSHRTLREVVTEPAPGSGIGTDCRLERGRGG